MTEVVGTGEARCTVGDSSAPIYTRAELGGGYLEYQINPSFEASSAPPDGLATAVKIHIEDDLGWPGTMDMVIAQVSVDSDISRATALKFVGPLDFTPPEDVGTSGAQAGFHLRRDWQKGALVLGAELEVSALSLGSANWSMHATAVELATLSQSIDMSVGALGAFKWRAGLAQGQVLTYVTGGIGGAHASATIEKELGTDFLAPSTEDASGLLLGVTAGTGVAWQPAPGVTLSAETLYYRFLTDLSFSDGQSVSLTDAWSTYSRLSFKLD